MAIVSGTRYSMVVHPGIKERVSVNLKDVTVREALDTMREMYGYEYKVQGTRIMIEPVTIANACVPGQLSAERSARAAARSA